MSRTFENLGDCPVCGAKTPARQLITRGRCDECIAKGRNNGVDEKGNPTHPHLKP